MNDFELDLGLGTPAPNKEMARLREMLDEAGIKWHDASSGSFCRTQGPSKDDKQWQFSAVCGPHAYGEIELWTQTMRDAKPYALDPIGLDTAEEAFALIRAEVDG